MYDIVYVNLSDNLDGYTLLKQKYPHVILLDSYFGIVDALQRIKHLCYTDMVWLVHDNWTTESGDILSWRPFAHDKLIYWSNSLQTLPAMDSIKQGDGSSLINGNYLLPLNYECSPGELEDDSLTNISVVTGTLEVLTKSVIVFIAKLVATFDDCLPNILSNEYLSNNAVAIPVPNANIVFSASGKFLPASVLLIDFIP